jgi:hypothetical protein
MNPTLALAASMLLVNQQQANHWIDVTRLGFSG